MFKIVSTVDKILCFINPLIIIVVSMHAFLYFFDNSILQFGALISQIVIILISILSSSSSNNDINNRHFCSAVLTRVCTPRFYKIYTM